MALTHLLHCDTVYPENATVLEVGCGVGAQTIPLALNSPKARITAIDVSADRGIDDLVATTQPAGVFCYTFFKAIARV